MNAPATVTIEPRRNIYFCTYCKNDWSQIVGGHAHECPACGKDDIREIIVAVERRPIPVHAFFDGDEESNRYGYGPDRNTAINDLISNFGE